MSAIKEVDLKLTDDQKAKLAAFREKTPEAKNVRDSEVYRYLNYQWFDVDKASASWKEAQKWRKDNKVDGILERKYNNADKIRKLIPFDYHGYDVDGRPIYWERTGKIHCHALLKFVSLQDIVDSHIYGMELLISRMEEQSKKLGRRVEGFTAVFDLDGLSLGHRNAIPWLRKCQEIDGLLYPGLVGRIIVINAPWIMPMMFNLIKGFLHEDTQSKIQVLGGDLTSELPKLIAKEHLPVEFKGECTACGGKCVAVLDAADLLQEGEDDGLEKKNVAAGGNFSVDVKIDSEGGELQWYFLSEGDYDIDFSVTVTTADGKKIMAKPTSRCVTSKGSYSSDGACSVKITFDNSFSWLNSKDIKYYTTVIKKDVSALLKKVEKD